jgi:thermostable 8-oxoguanine DNA glycosylase
MTEFKDKPVQFNFKMPSANQQAMLFEKIQFFVTGAQMKTSKGVKQQQTLTDTTQADLLEMLRKIFKS